jgi:hypothetical protein
MRFAPAIPAWITHSNSGLHNLQHPVNEGHDGNMLRLIFFTSRTLPFGLLFTSRSRPVLQDFKYTLRLWIARPSSTAFAIAALAIAIGANTGYSAS